MKSQRIMRLATFILAAVLAMSVFSLCQPRQYVLHKFKADGGVVKSTTIHPEQRVQLAPNERLAIVRTGEAITPLKSAEPPRPAFAGRRLSVVPETYYARIAGTTEQVVLTPILISDGPMRYNKSTGLFHGSLLVILDEAGQPAPKPLSQPVSFTIASEAEHVAPKNAAIDHSNLPAAEIQISTGNPSDSVQVTFITSTNPQGYRTSLPVEPYLAIKSSDTVLQGYGIEKTSLSVSLTPPGAGNAHTVHVSASQGFLDPEDVRLEQGQSSTRLRSESTGRARITADVPGFPQAEFMVTYVFPTRFLIFTLIGGILGIIVRKRKKKEALVHSVIAGIVWGVIVSIAWAGVGLNLLDLPLPNYINESVVVVLSALGAMVGPGKKVSIGKSTDPD